jgi:molybdenum cofactor guanylyltransferase
LLGIILCGGISSRMGTDKGLLLQETGITWAKLAQDKMAGLGLPVKLSVADNQLSSYLHFFGEAALLPDNRSLSVQGPLLGIMSSHLQYPEQDLMVLAVDMPSMDKSVLQELLMRFATPPDRDAYIFTNDGEPEPLCAIYTARALNMILKRIRKKEHTRHSMKFMLTQLEVDTYPVTEPQKKYFRNFNAPSDLGDL